MMSSNSRSVLARIVVVLVVLASAVVFYEFYSRPHEVAREFAGIPAVVKWTKSKEPFWEGLQYVSLRNEKEVNESLVVAIQRSALLEQLELGQRLQLTKTLGTLFVALGAVDSNEYLRLIRTLRKLRAAPHEDGSVLLNYKQLTGGPMPADMPPVQALDLFWKGRSGGPTHPVEASLIDPKGLAFSIGEFDGHREKWQNEPSYSEVWGNPASTSLVKMTEPLEDSQEVLRMDGKLLRLGVDAAVRTKERLCAPLHVSLFWSTKTNSWCVEFVSIQMDRNFFWPI